MARRKIISHYNQQNYLTECLKQKKIYELKTVTYRWMRFATQITENA